MKVECKGVITPMGHLSLSLTHTHTFTHLDTLRGCGVGVSNFQKHSRAVSCV